MTNPRLKILFITRWYPPSSGTFAEKQAQAISLYCDVVVLAVLPDDANATDNNPILDTTDPEFNVRIVRVFYPAAMKNPGKPDKPLQFVRYSAALVRGCFYLFKKYKRFDLVHVNILSRPAIPAIFLKFFRRVPYIITEHWSRYLPENNSYQGSLRKIFTKFAVRHSSAITTVSEFLKRGMNSNGLQHPEFRVIPNAVNTALFCVGESPRADGKKRIIHISNLNDRVKNISGILRTIAELSRIRNDFELHIVGGKEHFREAAEQYASQLGLLGTIVFFKGILRNQDLVHAIQQSDFLLMFSNYESFCAVIPECLSCGIPVLSSNAGGVPEFFPADSGILVNVGDENELLHQLTNMLDKCREYDRHKAREFVLNRFSYPVVGRQYYDLYCSVINAGSD